jgi:hypothetical protein
MQQQKENLSSLMSRCISKQSFPDIQKFSLESRRTQITPSTSSSDRIVNVRILLEPLAQLTSVLLTVLTFR